MTFLDWFLCMYSSLFLEPSKLSQTNVSSPFSLNHVSPLFLVHIFLLLPEKLLDVWGWGEPHVLLRGTYKEDKPNNALLSWPNPTAHSVPVFPEHNQLRAIQSGFSVSSRQEKNSSKRTAKITETPSILRAKIPELASEKQEFTQWESIVPKLAQKQTQVKKDSLTLTQSSTNHLT